jgi:hypothetical protein
VVPDVTTLPLVGRSLRRFAWADVKATLRTAVRAFAWTTGGVGLALFAAALLNPSRVEPLTVASVIATFIGALAYATLPGLVTATCAALFRLAGAWAFLPLVIFPVIALGVFWLGRGMLAAQGQDIVNALVAQLKGNWSALGGLRIHEPYVLVVVLLIYGLYSALQLPVLWQLFQYLLLVGAFTATALLLTCMITLPPLLWAIARRTAWRYAKHIALG